MSRAYQLAVDRRATHHDGRRPALLARRVLPLEAEQLLDALAQVTGVPVQFARLPAGPAGRIRCRPRRRAAAAGVDGMGERFLKVFGKPDRLLTCECERNDDPGLLQAFQLITGEL